MWNDVIDLRDFYATPLGRTARRMIERRIRSAWPVTEGQNILGIGYATPFLGSFRSKSARVLAAMPAPQGVLHWPAEGAGLTALTDELDLPFPDLSMDKVLLVHALECAERIRPLMRETWRVLSDSGSLLVIVPNRRGIWARLERTPFGYGQPYSQAQISRLLRDSLFTPVQSHGALFVPPTRSRMVLSSAPAWEEIGQRWFPAFSGIVMAEARKQIYAAEAKVQPTRRAYAPFAARTPGAPT